MARADLADDLEKQYQKALDHGAEIIIPLERISDNEFNPGLMSVKEGKSYFTGRVIWTSWNGYDC